MERAIASGEEHAFQVQATAGRVLRAAVEQRGIDLEVRLEAPEGRELLAVDSPTGPRGPEVLAYRPEASGELRLVVRALRRGTMSGSYRLEVGETDDEEAELAMSRAASLYRQGGRERWTQAVEELRSARSARALFFLGVLHRLLDEPVPALEALERARALFQEEGGAAGEAASWNETGYLHGNAGHLDPAREAYERALEGWRVLGDRHGEAQTLNNLGLLEHSRGELRQAVEHYEAAALLFQGAGDLAQAALVRNNLAGVQGQLGEPRAVLEGYREALALLRQTEERSQEPRLLLNLAGAHRALGELREALAGYRQALDLFRLQGDRRGEGSALNSLGMAWLDLGEPKRARSLLEQSLTARRASGDRRGEAVTLQNLGLVRDRLGEPREALKLLEQALALRQDDRLGRASTLEQMGAVHASLGEPAEALRLFDAALEIRGGEGDPLARGRALISAAEARIALGQPGPAAESLRSTAERLRALGDRSGEARALVALARVERDQGRPAQALELLDTAFERIEDLRSRIGSPELRASYLAARRGAYELAIDVRLDLHRRDPAAGHDRAALEASERARARSLLDLLGASGGDAPADADPELVRRRRLLREQAGAKEMRRLALLAADAPVERRRGVERELEAVLQELQLLDGAIGGAAGAVRWSAPEIRLDGDTLLLEYALGERRSALWAVSASSIELFELPGREEIEALAARVYRQWSVLGAAGDGSAAELGRVLLGPVAGRLTGKRLAIVPDGALHYLPFAALPLAGEPLLVRHEVVTLPSASFLAAQRQALVSRPPASRGLAVLADPVFDARDPRVRGGKAPAANADATRDGDPLFDRLASSRREADAIASLDKEAMLALDFQARRALVTDGRLGDYRVLHFATHGTFQGEHPELSGIVLSLVDEAGRPQEGFLRLPDLHALSLAADLVVLSGCQTALGREVRGEGLVGLSQGFLDAGARNVVASLWQVPDRATAELMAAFYRAFLQRGASPAAALREAQLAVRARRGWSEPYHWASFILMGEGR